VDYVVINLFHINQLHIFLLQKYFKHFLINIKKKKEYNSVSLFALMTVITGYAFSMEPKYFNKTLLNIY